MGIYIPKYQLFNLFYWCLFFYRCIIKDENMLQRENKLRLSPYIDLYDKIIPSDHLLKQISDLLDFSFVFDVLKDKYTMGFGRKDIDPVMMFKYLFLKILYPCSDIDLVNRAKYDISFKYFLGLMPEDDVISSSILTKF